MTDPGPGREPPPRWDRLLEPFRTEAAMFRVLLWVLAAFVVGLVAKLVLSAVF